MTLSRRDVLMLAAGAAGALPLLAACDSLGTTEGSTGGLSRSGARLPDPFGVPLPIPPLLQPVRRDATTDYYELTQRTGRAEILPGVGAEIWGDNGVFPGPTIVSTRGRCTVVTCTNELPVPTVVHLHGGRTPAAMNPRTPNIERRLDTGLPADYKWLVERYGPGRFDDFFEDVVQRSVDGLVDYSPVTPSLRSRSRSKWPQ